ncbi:MAG: hypothetical protein JOZ50_03270 [Candidatus Eremiobacteraeota bacterium]|nr:hypothetical protein [Candidatus Eremiobacteraeota bacterium]MBV8595249.1 hypothetical protein [Candidatus Eremiobacteraeota bacterium]MBV8669019.1 hypothetical protein [Candidatus Eremiobacteraeota bacterium]
MSTQDFMWLALGIAALITAGGLAYLCIRVGIFVDKRQSTMERVERLLDGLQAPVTQTLEHVNGVAGNVDAMVGRVDRVTQSIEKGASGLAKAADKAQSAVSPTVANVVGLVAGISQGAQQFFRTRRGNGASTD